MVPKLRLLQLENLPEFKTLCRHNETWPCLEQVEVWDCEGLRRLPLTNQNVGTKKEIKGESEWWDALEWDDDQTKTSLLHFFHPQSFLSYSLELTKTITPIEHDPSNEQTSKSCNVITVVVKKALP